MALRNHFLFTLSLFVVLFLSACEGGTETDHSNNGNDTLPPVEEGRPEGTYDVSRNLLDPQNVEFFQFYNRQRAYPFNSNVVKNRGIRSMAISQYTANENDSLKADTPAEGLIASKTFDFTFNAEGKVLTFDSRAYILGDPADSTFLSYQYGDDGQPQVLNITSATGKTAGVYTYDQMVDTEDELDKVQLGHYQDPEGISVRYLYDPAGNRRYETHYDKNGEGTVIVYGNDQRFEGSVGMELQEQILERTSTFVDYGSAPNLKEVMLIEVLENKPQRIIEFQELGEIKGTFTYNYNEDGSLHRIDYADDGGGTKTETRFHYNEFGDVSKVVFNEDNPDAGNLTSIQEFEYDKEGRLIRRIRSKKVGVGSVSLDRIDVVTY